MGLINLIKKGAKAGKISAKRERVKQRKLKTQIKKEGLAGTTAIERSRIRSKESLKYVSPKERQKIATRYHRQNQASIDKFFKL